MKGYLNPGSARKEVVVHDNIVYSHVTDLEGKPLDLRLSILMPNDISLTKAVPAEGAHAPKPALLWVPGNGWQKRDLNMMLGEMVEFARAGYVVASMQYRSVDEGHYPAQLKDVKTAIRFLRAHAEQYEIDPDHIGVFGRSAGGHLAAFAAMNTDGFDGEEWKEYSSRVQACIDMFGPVDMQATMDLEIPKLSDPNFRWHRLEDTHGGRFLGGDPATMYQRAKESSPIHYINANMCPIQILHGDCDPVVPVEVSSEPFYQKLVEAGLEGQSEFYIVKNGEHGSQEFFQDSVKQVMIRFWDKYLK